ncbi:MAG: substrate-binding domain-containing protein [Deltaproteobacteria bacterium]|nr:substrate-binding domain-containing protein [Deltaproteobacteria bacterium]
MNGLRTKIGVLIDAVHELYQAGIWKGIVAEARERDLDLLTFVGTTQDGTAFFCSEFEDYLEYHYDMVVDFALRSDIDGLIVLTSPITNIRGKAYVENLCRRFGTLPLVCVSEKVPGYHHVLVDNATGIEATIAHLVAVHNLRNIAFIKGPDDHEEATERLAAYRRGVEQNGLVYRPELVVDGGFITRNGEQAVQRLLERRVEFDGIVAVNDYAAIGALHALSSANLLVPSDVAVTGFDDVPEASRVTPSLATVRQPLALLGKAAVGSLLAQLGDTQLQADVVLPTEPLQRRSCGCFSSRVLRARAAPKQVDALSQEEVVSALWQTALEHVDRDAPAYPGDEALRERVVSLVDSLIWDVHRPVIRNIFLNEVDIMLFRAERFSNTDTLMAALLRELTVYAASLFDRADQIGEAGNLLQQAGTFVREQLNGRSNRTQLAEDEFRHRIRITNQRLVSSFSFEQLIRTMSTGFPALGIRSFALWRFDAPVVPQNWQMPNVAELFFGYRVTDDNRLITVSNAQMDAQILLPEQLRCDDAGSNYIFMPYHFENRYIGFAVYEYAAGAPLFIYEEIRGHLSATLAACYLQSQK